MLQSSKALLYSDNRDTLPLNILSAPKSMPTEIMDILYTVPKVINFLTI